MWRKIFIAALVASVLPVAAFAAGSSSSAAATGGPEFKGWGPRVGFSTGPDQFLMGAQIDFGELAPMLNFVPNIDLGFGDHVTTIDLNGDLHYLFKLRNSPWRPYVGAGFGVTFSDESGGGSSTDVGGSIIGGATVPTRSGNQFFSEVKLGLGDIANFKLLVGWNFHM